MLIYSILQIAKSVNLIEMVLSAAKFWLETPWFFFLQTIIIPFGDLLKIIKYREMNDAEFDRAKVEILYTQGNVYKEQFPKAFGKGIFFIFYHSIKSTFIHNFPRKKYNRGKIIALFLHWNVIVIVAS